MTSVIVGAAMLPDGAMLEAEVVVVGAGPVGIILALELARTGVEVLLVESGEARFDPEIQELAEIECDPAWHSRMATSTRRQIGGTSNISGGRYNPYDPIDFEQREWMPDTGWPIGYGAIEPYLARACEWFSVGRPVFDAADSATLARRSLVPGLPDGDVRASLLERWSPYPNIGQRYADDVAREPRVRLVPGLTCTEILTTEDGSRAAGIRARSLDGRSVRVSGRVHVVACGGLGSTRLLLCSDSVRPEGLGNAWGHLGRWYMGHVDGRIVRVRFAAPARATIHSHERDWDGVWVRRRLSFAGSFQREHGLPNIVAWLANPELGDATHRDGSLSLAYLVLRSPLGRFLASDQFRTALTRHAGTPSPISSHVRNVLLQLPRALVFAVCFGARRALSRGHLPNPIFRSDANEYPLHYHAEHLPSAASRVTLTDQRDAVGMRRLAVDLRFSDADVEGVLAAHRLWDDYLRRHECGELEYFPGDPAQRVLEQANGGRHQIGTTRMSARPEDGVVDPNLAVHGTTGLYVVSSSVLPSSSQAGPTLTTAALALRAVDHIRAQLRPALATADAGGSG